MRARNQLIFPYSFYCDSVGTDGRYRTLVLNAEKTTVCNRNSFYIFLLVGQNRVTHAILLDQLWGLNSF